MSDLPTGNPETFIGEFEDMNLDDLRDKMFCVAISTGDRNKPQFIPESIVGPMNFLDMVESVANFYIDEQLHAKAMILGKRLGEKPQVLDACTIDYIEAKYVDILAEAMLTGELEKQFTCKAGFLDWKQENDEEPSEQDTSP